MKMFIFPLKKFIGFNQNLHYLAKKNLFIFKNLKQWKINKIYVFFYQ